jgi:hypothetical protein
MQGRQFFGQQLGRCATYRAGRSVETSSTSKRSRRTSLPGLISHNAFVPHYATAKAGSAGNGWRALSRGQKGNHPKACSLSQSEISGGHVNGNRSI